MRSIFFVFIIFFIIAFQACKDSGVNNPVDQSNMNLVSVYSTNASTNGVYVTPINLRDYALIADGTNGLQIVDITIINQPDSVSSYDTDGNANDVTASYINGDLYAFISDYDNGFVVLDIDNPSNPFLIGTILITGFVNTSFIDQSNKLAYIAMESGQIQVYDISQLPDQPTFVASIPIGSSGINGLYLSGNYLYAAAGNNGLAVIDVTNPANPQLNNVFNTTGVASDVAVNGGFAYVADSYNGMLILDVTSPQSPVYKSKFTGTGQILGLYANNNNVFCADNTYGIENVNVSNASSPNKVGYIQTNSSANNIFYSGGYIFLAAAEGGLGIYQPTSSLDNR